MYGVQEPGQVGSWKGLDALRGFIASGRKAKLGDAAGPPLSRSDNELEAFRKQYRIPRFESKSLAPGSKVRVVVGMDGGSTSSKAVVIDEQRNILKKEYQLSKGNPIQDVKEILARLKAWAEGQQAILDVIGFGATGYAADVLEKTVHADANIVETVAHMTSATSYFGEIDVVCDIGGQDIKVLFLQNGDIKNFRLSNQCSAVSIIGEFWAMTTEGDGNYKLQRFLEQEGAECDIQLVTNWILYSIWEGRYDARERAYLRGKDSATMSIKAPLSRVELHRATLALADIALRSVFQAFARLGGAPVTTCPTWTRSRAWRMNTTTIVCAEARATWRWASSSST